VLLLFAGTALWFLAHDHRPPPPKGFAFQQEFKGPKMPNQPMPMPQWQPQQPPIQPRRVPAPNVNPWSMLKKGMMMRSVPQANEQFIRTDLVQGQLKHKSALAFQDPSHPLNPGHRRKVFVVELEARQYTLEMHIDPPRNREQRKQFVQGRDLDPFVMIEGAQGKLLAWNDDKEEPVIGGGHDLNSFLSVRIPAKGVYHVTCTSFAAHETGAFVLHIHDDDVGKPVAAKQPPPLPLPQPKETQQDLTVEKRTRRNLTISALFQSDHPLVPDLCWSRDASAFFTLDEKGTLRRISLVQQREERRLDLTQSASSLTLAKSGLLVSLPQLEEVWLIDTETLQIAKRICAPGVRRVTSAPSLDLAFASAKLPVNPNPKDVLLVLDVAQAKPLKHYEHHSAKHLAAAPDGKHLFAEDGANKLVRYRLDGNDVVFDQESPPIGSESQGIYTSPDGKYVCLSSRLGNLTNAVNPPAKLHTIYVFQADKLAKPAFSVHTGPSPRALGFDPKTHVVFAHNSAMQFMQFNETGAKILETNLPGAEGPAGEPRQFLTHPDGHRVLVRTETTIYEVRLPKDEDDEKK
jgi:hypothetical protein